jgi:hypothetical protein
MVYVYEVILEDMPGEVHKAQDYASDEPVSAGEIIELQDGLRCHVQRVHFDEAAGTGLITADLRVVEIGPE